MDDSDPDEPAGDDTPGEGPPAENPAAGEGDAPPEASGVDASDGRDGGDEGTPKGPSGAATDETATDETATDETATDETATDDADDSTSTESATTDADDAVTDESATTDADDSTGDADSEEDLFRNPTVDDTFSARDPDEFEDEGTHEHDLDPRKAKKLAEQGEKEKQSTAPPKQSSAPPEQSTAPPGPMPAGAGAGGGGGGGGGMSHGGGYPNPDPMPQGAPDDQEMPLTEHVREMTQRLLIVLLVVLAVGGIAVLYADQIINFLWYSFLGPGHPVCPGPNCPEVYRPRVYNPLSLVLARFKTGALIGIIAALPVAVYETYRFMRPGLYPKERRYYLAAVPTSLVLATIGVTFAYALVLPLLFSYFAGYSQQAAQLAFGLSDTFNLIVMMLGFFAFVFQIPLLVMLAILMGVTSRRWLEDRRLYFWAAFGGIAFLFSPDPTGMAPLLVAATMIALFDGTLTLLRWATEGTPLPGPDGLATYRPVAWFIFAVAGYLVSAAPVPESYHDQLPAAFLGLLADAGLSGAVAIVIGGGLIVTFEAVAYINRRYAISRPLYDALRRLRLVVWPGAAVLGYLADPDPQLVAAVESVNLPAVQVAAVVIGLALLYEGVILALRRRG
ncbi:MAG: twin-arginine translocase subunit TatC [Haloarculaceae archaeon]